MRSSARLPAWTISLGTHAALAVAVVVALGGAYRRIERPSSPERLVWVEPEPPRSGLTGGVADAASGRQTAPPVIAGSPPVPPVEDAAPRPAVAPKPLARAERPRPASTAHPRPAPAVASAPVAPAADTTQPASSAGVASGTPLGSGVGVSSGVVGGLGDAPLSLRDVAAPPEIVDRVLPEYPARARTMKIEGQVLLEVVLDRTGRVEDSIRVSRSVPMLDAAAIAAVRQWRFRPARSHDGSPVRVLMEIPVRFVLR
jgi:periplasmic protein TonB